MIIVSTISVVRLLASNLWQQVELASEFESDLPDTVDRAGSCLLLLMLGKLNLFHLTGQINLVRIVKMEGSALD